MLNKLFFAKNNSLKKIDVFLIIFIMIQPVFDLKIFYNSISTLIRVVIILGLFLFYFISSKNNKKYYLLIYPLLVFIYFIFHHINALNFNSLVPGNFNYSLLKEGLYFVKMLSPFLLMYSIYKSNLSKIMLLNIIKFLVCIIGITIIVSNIFVFSYGSYSDQVIKASFFSWFTNNNYSYQDLASKGLFEYANQIGAILLMFLPFSLYSFIESKKTINFFVLLINIFSMFLLGTKVSVLGIFIVFSYTFLIYIFHTKLVSRQKLQVVSLISCTTILLIYVLILFKNPIFIRINEDKFIETSSTAVSTVESNINNIEASLKETTSNQSNILDANSLEKKYTSLQIKKEFITQNYPYKYDENLSLTYSQ